MAGDMLDAEIEKQRSEVKAEAYPMSIGELASIYTQGELNLHPKFQRFFRWDTTQKSKLIESILLGIPLPSIFVAQRHDGKWDVVDGLQRLSTIFELMGILRDKDDNVLQPLRLAATKYLPSMAGRWWQKVSEDIAQPHDAISSSAQLIIKRAKLDLKIVLRESSSSSKYELFQRLNTGGSITSDQEVRTCMIIMANPKFFDWIESLASDQNFQNCVSLSDAAQEKQYHLELVSRFISLRTLPSEQLGKVGDLKDFLDNAMLNAATNPKFDGAAEELAFRSTFKMLSATMGDDAFCRFNGSKFRGPFLVSAFEAVAIGLAHHAVSPKFDSTEASLPARIKSLWSKAEFLNGIGSGVRGSTRVPTTISVGRDLFKP